MLGLFLLHLISLYVIRYVCQNRLILLYSYASVPALHYTSLYSNIFLCFISFLFFFQFDYLYFNYIFILIVTYSHNLENNYYLISDNLYLPSNLFFNTFKIIPQKNYAVKIKTSYARPALQATLLVLEYYITYYHLNQAIIW